ncbi:MAG: translocation/assembly module TamB domain-containing protein, partial [Candidatus Krumholzibacteriia bacterium]
GKSGSGGSVRGDGQVIFEGLRVADFDLSLDAERVPIYSVPQMMAVVSGHVDMRGVHLGTGGPIPEFRGSLQVLQAEVTQEFTGGGSEADVLESTDMPEWLAEVGLDASGKVWIKNSQADAELYGSVQLVRSTSGMDVKGRATVKRGHYSLYFRRFEITHGELDFSRYPGFEPDLDIEARTGRSGNRIYVHLTGRPSEPHLDLSSDSGASSDELQQMFFTEGTDNPVNPTFTVVEQIFQDLEYIDSIHIDPAGSDTLGTRDTAVMPFVVPLNLSAGKAVSDRVFLTYTHGLNQSDISQRFAIEVDIIRGLLLESSYERRNIPDNQPNRPQNAFDVDLKFRYEY